MTHGAAQAEGCVLPSIEGRVSTLPIEQLMGENGRPRSVLPPVVTMNCCSTCATPLPSDWEVCPGCELYGTAIEALDDYDSARAAAGLLDFDPARITELAEAGTALSMRIAEAVSEVRLRRVVLGWAMSD